jgi:hypothetical protein
MLLSEPVVAGAAGACLLGGLAVGAWAGWPRTGSARIAAGLVVVLALAGAGASFSGLVPGRPGFWLDAGAPMLLAYGLGCLVGAAVRAVRGRG